MKKKLFISIMSIFILVTSLLTYKMVTLADSDTTEQQGNELSQEVLEDSQERVDPTGTGKGYAAILYNNSNGLPTSEANAIAETADGFIWIGGYSGLTRYDGNNFYRYEADSGIDSVVSLFVDSKDRLWIGTNENGIAVLDKGQITFFENVDGVRSSSIRSIAEDSKGNIYFGTTHGMAYIDNDLKLHSFDIPQLDSRYIYEIRCGSSDIIYGITSDGSIFGIKDFKVIYFYTGSDIGIESINSIFADEENEGLVYLGTEQSDIYYLDLKNQATIIKHYSTGELIKINRIDVYDGYIWACADNGIGFINFAEESNEIVKLQNLPMETSIIGITSDTEGNLWFVSSRQGVMKIVPNIFRNVNQIAGLDKMVVNSTCTRHEMLYIATDEGLVIVNSRFKVVENSLTNLLQNIRIRSIIKDSKNNLWISTYSEIGLICYAPDNSITNYNMHSGILSNKVRTVYEAADGSILVASQGGLNVIRDGEVVESYDADNGINNTAILTICEGDNGKYYLGSDGDGIYILDGKNVTRLSKDDGLKSEVILRIRKDETRDIYWIITSNSIAYMKDEKITTIRNFPYSNNFDIFSDKGVNAWILSSNGIYVVNEEQLLNNQEIDYIFYDSHCGLPCVATANSFSELSEDNNLFIAGNEGVSIVNLQDADEKVSDIRLSVPFVKADDNLIYADSEGKIRVPASTVRLTVYPYAFTYTLRNPKVTYELVGIDKKGGNTITKRELDEVTYTNLDGGEYVFRLTVHDTFDHADSKSIEVIISKEKTVYETLWFKILICLAAAGLIGLMVYAYIRKKTEALIKKQEQNKKFIDEMVFAFAKCVDVKDTYTNGHSFRVAKYTKMFAEKLGFEGEELENIYHIALLHDIGKVFTPIEILNKPGKLTDEEFAIMKQHATNGYEILKDITVLPQLALGAGYHHERIDGKGYPRGLKGDEIPMIAKIIAVADCLDAMTSTRPYRKAMPLSKAISIITEVSGTQLSPDVVKAFLQLVSEGAFEDLRILTEERVKEEAEEEAHKKQEEAQKKEEEAQKKEETEKQTEHPDSQKHKKQSVKKREASRNSRRR